MTHTVRPMSGQSKAASDSVPAWRTRHARVHAWRTRHARVHAWRTRRARVPLNGATRGEGGGRRVRVCRGCRVRACGGRGVRASGGRGGRRVRARAAGASPAATAYGRRAAARSCISSASLATACRGQLSSTSEARPRRTPRRSRRRARRASDGSAPPPTAAWRGAAAVR